MIMVIDFAGMRMSDMFGDALNMNKAVSAGQGRAGPMQRVVRAL